MLSGRLLPHAKSRAATQSMADLSHTNRPEVFVQSLLEDMGFSVDKLPESEVMTPDFYASKGADHYLIEVKSISPSGELIEKRDRQLESGKVYEESHTLKRQSSITKIVSGAKNQLAAGTPDPNCCRLLCFVGLGHNATAKLDQTEATLFGTWTVTDWTTEDGPSMQCYYFGFSDFYRYCEYIDGALLLDPARDRGRLAVNHHSPRYDIMKDSAMVVAFGDGVLDPLRMEANGTAWVVDSDVDRRDEVAVLEYVKKKYSLGTRVTVMAMDHFSAGVLVPSSE